MSVATATPVRAGHRLGISRGASLVFSSLFAVSYGLSFYFNWPLFAYYPQVNEFHLNPELDSQLGPPILWYGWLATAALVGAVAAIVVPERLTRRLWPGLAWAVPGAVILAMLVYEKRWFL